MTVRLSSLAGDLAIEPPGADPEVSGISEDSRRIEPGMVFVAVPGSALDGHAYISDAVARGAVAIVAERTGAIPPGLPSIRTPSARATLADLAARFYGRPADGRRGGWRLAALTAAVLALGVGLFQTRQLESQETSGSMPGAVGVLAWIGRAAGVVLAVGGMLVLSRLMLPAQPRSTLLLAGAILLAGGAAQLRGGRGIPRVSRASASAAAGSTVASSRTWRGRRV